jgi:SAM-dependent methyltransferase
MSSTNHRHLSAHAAEMTPIVEWILESLPVRHCDSPEYMYDEMESQADYSLPVVHEPFDPTKRNHWKHQGHVLDFLLSTRAEAKRVLDFGPGDGWPSLPLAASVAEVIGADGSAKRVEVCAANATRLGIGNARFVHLAPGEKLPFPDNEFDAVVAASSIEQSPEPEVTVGELYRVLRPGGRLRCTYEDRDRYRHGEEHVAWVDEHDGGLATLELYERELDRERATMIKIATRIGRINGVFGTCARSRGRSGGSPGPWSAGYHLSIGRDQRDQRVVQAGNRVFRAEMLRCGTQETDLPHWAVEESPYRAHLATVRCVRTGRAVKASEDLELTIDEKEFRHLGDPRGTSGRLLVFRRYPHRERTALADFALHADRPAEQFRELLRNRQSQTRAFLHATL